MIASGKQRYILMSHRKLRRVANEVRGKNVADAYNILRFMPYMAAKVILKKLIEVTNNAFVQHQLRPEQMVINEIFIDEGPAYKRFKPRAQGRMYRREKPTAHLTLRLAQSAK